MGAASHLKNFRLSLEFCNLIERKVFMSKTQVIYEATPNPQSMKFIAMQTIAKESAQFDDPQKCHRSPLAQKLFGFPWMAGVFIGQNFVTITKQDWVEWQTLADPLARLIEEHLENGEEVLKELPKTTGSAETTAVEGSPIQIIKTILEQEIKPAVAMDGGDIVFHSYENHVLYLEMHGACAGCPSSTMTLKMGIEARLKEAVPELAEVVSI